MTWTPDSWSGLEKKFQLLLNDSKCRGFKHNFETKGSDKRTYYIDFANPDLLIGFEVDSVQYHGTKVQKGRDELRQMYLEAAGWTIVRFGSADILGSPDWVIAEIRKTVGKTAKRGPLSPK
jgi:very-short-patch-repair endonuclease